MVHFESAGAAKIKVNAEEGPLQIRKGSFVRLLMPLPKTMRKRTSVPLWYFDPKSGEWREEGAARVVVVAGQQMLEAKLPHLSYWNADVPFEDKSSIWVKSFVTPDGKRGQAQLLAEGIDYSGWSDGDYGQGRWKREGGCVDVKRGSLVSLSVTLGAYRAIRKIRTTNTPSSCDRNPETGIVIEAVRLTRTPNTCLTGRVVPKNRRWPGVLRVTFVDAGGRPIAAVEADEEGRFCVDGLPLGEQGILVTTERKPSSYDPVKNDVDYVVFESKRGMRTKVRTKRRIGSCTPQPKACARIGTLVGELTKRAAYDELERLVLRDGTSLTGAVISSTNTAFYFDTQNGVIRVPKNRVMFQEFLR